MPVKPRKIRAKLPSSFFATKQTAEDAKLLVESLGRRVTSMALTIVTLQDQILCLQQSIKALQEVKPIYYINDTKPVTWPVYGETIVDHSIGAPVCNRVGPNFGRPTPYVPYTHEIP